MLPQSPQSLDSTELQLSEVLDGADHLGGVAVLVVVPGHDLHLIGVVVQLGNHGLGSIEQRAIGHADDIGGNHGLLVVAVAGGGSSLHGGVDGFLGHVLALNDGNQDGGGTGAYGHTLGRADQLAVQLGDNQADGLGSAGGVGNDVLRASAGTAQIALAMGAVQDHLIAGVRMHGGHDAALDGIYVVQSLGHGSQAVGGAGSGGDDVIFLGQGVLVNREHDGGQIVAGRSRDNNLLGAGGDVRHGLFLLGVEAGALQHHVYIQLAPGAVGSVLFGVDLDLGAVHDDGILSGGYSVLVLADLAAVGTLSGVVLEQMGQHRGAGQVVDGDNLVALSAEHLAESKTTNAAKTVDSNFNHGKDLLHTVSGGLMPHRYYYTRFPRVWQYL